MIIFSQYYCHVLLLLNLLSVFSCVNHFNLWWYNNYLEFLIKQTVYIMNTAGENQSHYDSLRSDHDNIDCDMILSALQYLHIWDKSAYEKERIKKWCNVCVWVLCLLLYFSHVYIHLISFQTRISSCEFVFCFLHYNSSLLAILIIQTGTGTICLRCLHIWIKWLIFHICVSIITSKPCNTLWH